MSAVEGEKLRIELEKLRLETADLSRWRAKMLLALVSAILSPLIAVATYVISLHSSQASERIEAEDALYSQVSKDIGNPDPGLRLSALSSMGKFLRKPTESFWRSGREFTTSEERAQDAVTLLVSRLNTETDPDVVNSIIASVQSRPDLSLPLLLDADRRAASNFARAAGDYSGLRLLQPPTSTQQNIEEDMQLNILRASRLFDTGRELNGSFMAKRFLYSSPYRSIYLTQQRYAMGEGLSEQSPTPQPSEVNSKEQRLLQAAQFLEATSKALIGILKQRPQTSGTKKSCWQKDKTVFLTNWNGVVLVSGEFPDPADFSGFDLHGSYFFAKSALGKVIFRNANLKDADLTGFPFNNADFTNASYRDVGLCPNWQSYAPDTHLISQQINLVTNKDDPRCVPK
ncbi:MAG: pentapeptide repeat-containing protein [Terriglobales bacterium]|jgi:hypothetical protein